MDAYLAIETTGCVSHYDKVVVVTLYLDDGYQGKIVQLVEWDITKENINAALKQVQNIFIYNGNRVDLPFIREATGIDIQAFILKDHELLYDSLRCNIWGGLKETEKQLNIRYKYQRMKNKDAIKLWWKYKKKGDRKALAVLLEYNREKVMNLKIIRERMLWQVLVQQQSD